MTNTLPFNKPKWTSFMLGMLFLLVCSCGETAPPANNGQEPRADERKLHLFRILILGDSLTEGYGVSDNEAYPTLLEKKLNAELSPKTELNYEIINGGISGATTSGGVSRIDWFLRAKPDYLIVALGGNDGLRGIPVREIKKNIDRILRAAKKSQIPTMLAGMKIPPNYGESYATSFHQAFVELAEEHEIPLIPFLLQGVGGNSKMNLSDRIHPNPLGHEVLCQTVYQHLITILD
jgi:acyl-CoA thioesterase-1